MKRKAVVGIIVFLVVAVLLIIPSIASAFSSMAKQAGDAYKNVMENGDNSVVAAYKDNEITAAAVEYSRELLQFQQIQGKNDLSDREIIDNFALNMMMLEDAERRGITAEESEIEQMIASANETYNLPEGKEFFDEYCESAGITFEEYLEGLRELAPSLIIRQKLRDAIGREYCDQNGIEFTKINPPSEIGEAVDEYLDNLFEENKQYIKYYT